jgi:two-component system chemotaxis response regulator CheB
VAPPRNVVVVGASAGGVEALSAFVAELAPGLTAAVLVVLHVAPGGTSVLPGILDRSGPLPAHAARDGEPLEQGKVLVAVPDHHLIVDGEDVRLARGPRENGHRPAVDPLFRSAAASFGAHVVGIVLSGTRDDGTAGAAAIKAAGGRVLVQDPEDALYASMPASVLEAVGADGQGSAGRLGRIVSTWVGQRNGAAVMSATGGDLPVDPGRHEAGEYGSIGLTCPECGGAVYLDSYEGVAQFNCHTGHAFSPESFAAEQEHALEGALWSAVRHLKERAGLLRRLADRIQPTGPIAGGHFHAAAREADEQADIIRGLIGSRSPEPS